MHSLYSNLLLCTGHTLHISIIGVNNVIISFWMQTLLDFLSSFFFFFFFFFVSDDVEFWAHDKACNAGASSSDHLYQQDWSPYAWAQAPPYRCLFQTQADYWWSEFYHKVIEKELTCLEVWIKSAPHWLSIRSGDAFKGLLTFTYRMFFGTEILSAVIWLSRVLTFQLKWFFKS